MIASTPALVIEHALEQRIAPGARVRCGTRSPVVTCQVTRGSRMTIYVAVRWASDGRWHFRKVGAIA